VIAEPEVAAALPVIDGSHPQVSVVVPTRDRHALLAEALASIRALEGPDLTFEILVCDNGRQRAETERIAGQFAARYLPVGADGAGAARNAGLTAATGAFVAFLDDDDLWTPEHIRPHLALLAARPDLEAAVGRVTTTDEQRTPYGNPWPVSLPDDGDVFHVFLREYPQIGGTVARVGVRESVWLFDESLMGDQDWDWHLRLALRHRVGFVPRLCVLFRQRPAGSFDDLQWKRLGYARRVFLRAVRRAGYRRLRPAHGLRSMAHHLGMYYAYFVESAGIHLTHGRHRAARRALGYAAVASPAHLARDLVRSRRVWAMLPALLGSA
jgi:glycosyltransferase involved in cell wall biosynthesis